MRELLENFQDGHLAFEPCELISDAEMSVGTKREVRIIPTFQVETVGILELARIAIGRPNMKIIC